jgi:hypothetical protein
VLLVRRRWPVRIKGPLQLDLFDVVDHEYEYRAIVTNKSTSAANVIAFLNGRGCQEAIFGEAKEYASLSYVPCRRIAPNQLYTLATMLAHNLSRELHLHSSPTRRTQSPTRAPQHELMTLGTLRDRFIRRAGRLTKPQVRLRLCVSATGSARRESCTTSSISVTRLEHRNSARGLQRWGAFLAANRCQLAKAAISQGSSLGLALLPLQGQSCTLVPSYTGRRSRHRRIGA